MIIFRDAQRWRRDLGRSTLGVLCIMMPVYSPRFGGGVSNQRTTTRSSLRLVSFSGAKTILSQPKDSRRFCWVHLSAFHESTNFHPRNPQSYDFRDCNDGTTALHAFCHTMESRNHSLSPGIAKQIPCSFSVFHKEGKIAMGINRVHERPNN